MLGLREIFVCSAIAVMFWVLATLALHFCPGSMTGPVGGSLAFATSIPVGWLSIRLIRRAAALQESQIAAACLLVVAITTCIDGAALRFLPRVYADDDRTCRLAAAWLLWGYGVSGFVALVMGGRARVTAGPRGGLI